MSATVLRQVRIAVTIDAEVNRFAAAHAMSRAGAVNALLLNGLKSWQDNWNSASSNQQGTDEQ